MAKKKVRRRKASGTKYVRVDVRRLKIEDLEDAPYNPRVITAAALQGLASSLEQFGVISLPVVNVKGGKKRVVGGHQRVKVLRGEGETHVDCIVVELDDAQEKHANLTLNNAEIEGTFIPSLTRDVLAQVSQLLGGDEVKRFGALRLDALLRQVMQEVRSRPGIDDEIRHGRSEDDYIPTLLRTSANSKMGEVYVLGVHRLLCGRITAVGTLDVFEETKADAAFTRLVANEPFRDAFLDAHLGHLLGNTAGAAYVATNTARLCQVQASFTALGGHWSSTIVGYSPDVKPRAAEPYREAVVPILYGWHGSGTRVFYGDGTQGNTWRLKSAPPRGDVPVEAAVRHILVSTERGGSILDVLVSRGATLIAAEKTHRRLLGYVPSAREMDLVRKRWTRFVHGPHADWKAETAVAT